MTEDLAAALIRSLECGATLSACRCTLGSHAKDVPHHCEHGDDGPCGGMWLDDPEPGWKWIVRYPVEPALAEGVAQPIEPIREFFGIPWDAYRFRVPRGKIEFFPAPSLAEALDASATEVRGELS